MGWVSADRWVEEREQRIDPPRLEVADRREIDQRLDTEAKATRRARRGAPERAA